MSLGYVTDFIEKVLANFEDCNENKLDLIEKTMSYFLDLYLKDYIIMQSTY
jgi:hypothetical protein